MRLRRSALNAVLFPLSRKNTLKQWFGNWFRFFYWNRGHREAYELKYEVLKRQIEIEKQFKDQIPSKSSEPEKHEKNPLTFMQRHKERPVQCRNCIQFYLEMQNNSFSCLFHPGIYTMACPKSCPNPGLTLHCVAHKRRRWTCCDSGKETTPGCARRYHIPVEKDMKYERVMQQLNIRDSDIMENLDQKIEIARKENWSLQLKELMKGQLYSVEKKIADNRNLAQQFDTMKFV